MLDWNRLHDLLYDKNVEFQDAIFERLNKLPDISKFVSRNYYKENDAADSDSR